MKKKRIIPFRFWPGSWAMPGNTFLRAEAEYYFEGEALERRLAEIDAGGDEDALEMKLLDIDVKYKRKSAFEADCIREDCVEASNLTTAGRIKLAELKIKHKIGEPYSAHKRLAELKNEDNIEDRKLAVLDVDRAYDKIDESEYEKKRATIRNEPWVGIVDHGYNPADGIGGLFIEFDWNEQWISYLRANGYSGSSEDEIVERWFQDLNQTVAVEDGYNFIENAKRGNRFDRGDGSADYV